MMSGMKEEDAPLRENVDPACPVVYNTDASSTLQHLLNVLSAATGSFLTENENVF